jgi:hypothetical protein
MLWPLYRLFFTPDIHDGDAVPGKKDTMAGRDFLQTHRVVNVDRSASCTVFFLLLTSMMVMLCQGRKTQWLVVTSYKLTAW